MTAEQRASSAAVSADEDDASDGADAQDAASSSGPTIDLPSQPAATPPSRSEIFDLISNHRRRFTIHYCKAQEGPVELSDLAEYVASRELEKGIRELTSDERKRVYTSLQQTHLPRLERAGMITDDNGTIELTERIAELEIYLDIVPQRSIPWGVYYVGLSAISGLVLGLVYLEILPTEQIPELGWAGIVLGLFTVSSLVHLWHNRQYRLDRLDELPET